MKNIAFVCLIWVVIGCDSQPKNQSPSADETTLMDSTVVKDGEVTSAESKQEVDSLASIENLAQEEKTADFGAFYEHFEKPFQTHTFRAEHSKVIKGKEGTEIKIKANSFMTESGALVTGEVKFLMKEYYSTADILLSNLSTVSHGEMLETSGMLYIEAYSGGEKCKLKPNKAIDILFATPDIKDEMQLFDGQWNNGKMDWSVQKTTKATNEITKEDQLPAYIGGNTQLGKDLKRNLQYPAKAKAKGIEGTVKVAFVVTSTGSVKGEKVIESDNDLLNQAALNTVSKLKKWTPGRVDGKYVETNMTLPVRFTLRNLGFDINGEDFNSLMEQASTQTGDKQMNFIAEQLSTADEVEIEPSLFQSLSMGWINCDAFYKDSRKKIDFIVSPSSPNVEVKLIAVRLRSMMGGTQFGKNHTFYNVPRGLKVKLVAIKQEKEDYYLAVKTTTVSSKGDADFDFKPVSLAELKTELANLN